MAASAARSKRLALAAAVGVAVDEDDAFAPQLIDESRAERLLDGEAAGGTRFPATCLNGLLR